jgi:hypothetical protein
MALRFDRSVGDGLPYHMIMLDDVRRRIDQFDVLHFHIDLLPAPVVRDIADRTDIAAWPIGSARPRAVLWGLSRTASCPDLL